MATTKRAKQTTASGLDENYVYFCDLPKATGRDAFRLFSLARFERELPHEMLDNGDFQFVDGTKRYRVVLHSVNHNKGWAIFEVKQ